MPSKQKPIMLPSDLGTKRCSKCGSEKPYTDFSRNNAAKGGLDYSCRACNKERDRLRYVNNVGGRKERGKEWLKANPDRVRELGREYKSAHRDAHREQARLYKAEKGKEIQAQWRKRHPDKIAAHTAVSHAIRAGTLSRLPCERCASTQSVHAHHEDYNRPLSVVWLCKSCHGKRHQEINDEKRLAQKSVHAF